MSEQWIVGVDLGGTTTKIAFIDLNGEILHKWEIPTDNSNEGQNITINIANAIRSKTSRAKRAENKINWDWHGCAWRNEL